MKTLKMLIPGTLWTVAFGLLAFIPAGTFDYWQAWLFLAVVVGSGCILSVYFMLTNPAVVQRRMPAKETRVLQRIVAAAVFLLWGAMIVVSALDHRFGWSGVPPAVSVLGSVLVAVGIAAVGLVLVQNSHAAVTIRVESGQQVVSTGLYGMVRHPMYSSNIFLLVGTPLALGSYWGLFFVIPVLFIFTLRIRDEEKLLEDELAGYDEYMRKVRYRLVPGIW